MLTNNERLKFYFNRSDKIKLVTIIYNVGLKCKFMNLISIGPFCKMVAVI